MLICSTIITLVMQIVCLPASLLHLLQPVTCYYMIPLSYKHASPRPATPVLGLPPLRQVPILKPCYWLSDMQVILDDSKV
jgi:hypothetical protein